MARYNDIKIITHRTLYACLTHTIATVELHHIISSTIQCVNCQLSVSIGRPYTNDTNISNGYNCVSNYIYTILYLYVIQFNNYGPIDLCYKKLNVKTVILLYQTNFIQYCIYMIKNKHYFCRETEVAVKKKELSAKTPDLRQEKRKEKLPIKK
jgi:hypothetical protein